MPRLATHQPVQHRSPAARLDPYLIEECTLTLDEFRRLRGDPVPRRTRRTRRARHAAH